MTAFEDEIMKMRVMLMVAMLALSAPAFADQGGEGNNTGCNGIGNVNSPCAGGGAGGENGGGGGSAAVDVNVTGGNATATGGNATSTSSGNITNVTVNNTGGDTPDSQSQTANATIAIGNGGNIERPVPVEAGVNTQTTSGSGDVKIGGNATAPFSNANYAENNSSVGNVTSGDVTSTNTNNNTANGGAGGQGGTGGEAVASAVVESGAASAVVESGAIQYTYTERLQAPAIGQGSFAISGCSVGGNAGASGPGWAGFLGFGFTPQQCYDFMLAQAYQSLNEKKAACDILRNSKAGKRQEKRGIVLPGCEPQTVVVAPVPVPVDLSPYATKEELNRAFKASQSK